VENEGPLPCSKDPNTVNIVSQNSSVYGNPPHSFKTFFILCPRLDVPSDIIRFSYEISDAFPNPAVRVIPPHRRAAFVIGLIIFD
jgi:hypothetical protein